MGAAAGMMLAPATSQEGIQHTETGGTDSHLGLRKVGLERTEECATKTSDEGEKMHRRWLSRLPIFGLILSLTLCVIPKMTSVSAASLIDTTTNEEVPVPPAALNICNGDAVLLSGSMHIQNHYFTDTSGGSHLESHVNYQNVTGVGTPSGANYNGQTTEVLTVNDSSGPQFEQTFIQDFSLISQGSEPNLLIRSTYHITINANGETTSNVVNTRVVCRG